jgi:plastocyanin domain-containing protein
MSARTLRRALGLALALGPAALACSRGEVAPPEGVSGPIPVTVDAKGFTPTSISVKAGVPASLIFKRTSDATCAKQVVFPELQVTKDLPLNTAVAVDLPTDAARTLTFQCGMDMYKGSVVVR